METLERSLVKVFFNNSASAAGAGFLITPKHILTCAHVVIEALGIDRTHSTIPTSLLRIAFPFIAGQTPLESRVVVWKLPSDNGGGDVAVLEIVGEIPPTVLPARLIDVERGWSQEFRAYGFPREYPDGIWAQGFLLGKLANGKVQVQSSQAHGYFIEQGFSGTPVWSENHGGVVGMIVTADVDPSTRTAFLLPTGRITDVVEDTLTEFQVLYLPPVPKQEHLLTNLLTIERFAPQLYLAQATKTKVQEIFDVLNKYEAQDSEWLLKGGNILSFNDLNQPVWADICDQGTIETFDVAEWADTNDESKQRDFVFLLNKCLKSKVSEDLKYWKDKDYYYFRPTSTLKDRHYSYVAATLKTNRGVFVGYGRRDDGKPFYYRHSAFTGKFRRYDGRWYLEIAPTYHFTINGIDLYGDSETLLAGIKRLERNEAVLGQVRMWAYYLNPPANAFTPTSSFITFGQLLSLDADFGINDDVWLQNDEHRKAQVSENEAVAAEEE